MMCKYEKQAIKRKQAPKARKQTILRRGATGRIQSRAIDKIWCTSTRTEPHPQKEKGSGDSLALIS